MAKPWAKAFYNSDAWQNARKAALIRDGYLCTRCGELAQEVHHIKHLTARNVNDPAISLNLDNLASLCERCHKQHHDRDRKAGQRKPREDGYVFDENGYLVRAEKKVDPPR